MWEGVSGSEQAREVSDPILRVLRRADFGVGSKSDIRHQTSDIRPCVRGIWGIGIGRNARKSETEACHFVTLPDQILENRARQNAQVSRFDQIILDLFDG
jgi:hypothetical protein